ncbi:MAG: tRNA (adenosine(37)-N6)-dimethylallyltransferase MiaA [Hyphomicrobium sp.]
MTDRRPILIAGPTASGKSALALALAERLGGAIINADSMQVYAELRILTARPAEAELARAPHALYGHVPASQAYSAGRFITDAAAAIAETSGRGQTPILVGGTGLYFSALLEGLSPIPPADADARAYWRKEARRLGAGHLHAILGDRDAAMAARLAPNDAQRIVRALEILDTTGRSLATWQQERAAPVVDPTTAVRLVLNPDRAVLHARADARFDAMLEAGALGEAATLAGLGLDPTLPAMRAIGVGPLIAAARGEKDLDAATAAAKAETRRYIKRQQTWLRRRMIAWNSIETNEMECSVASAIAFIES